MPDGHLHHVEATDVLKLHPFSCLGSVGNQHAEALPAKVPPTVVEITKLRHRRHFEALLPPSLSQDLQQGAVARLPRQHHDRLLLALGNGAGYAVELRRVVLDVGQESRPLGAVAGTVVDVEIAIIRQSGQSLLLRELKQTWSDHELNLFQEVALQGLSMEGVLRREVLQHTVMKHAIRNALHGYLCAEILTSPGVEAREEALVAQPLRLLALNDGEQLLAFRCIVPNRGAREAGEDASGCRVQEVSQVADLILVDLIRSHKVVALVHDDHLPRVGVQLRGIEADFEDGALGPTISV
mmetsp:Transcript_12051/g.28768  ORF Transcript_12051/g.28768 Transcript_12051/m.28768 type:complete len:297 (+) Transcript_12051:805-1695(+)